MEQAIAGALPYIIMGVVVLMSLTVHEFSHGFVAYLWGDHTAKNAGRLTLNPIRHLDLWGSIVVPAMLILFSSPFVFGWAKPVPVNTFLMRDPKWGGLLSSIAGPISNLLLCMIGAVALKIMYPLLPSTNLLLLFLFQVVVVNFMLALFNLVPIPPLDGSRIWSSFLSPSVQYNIERYAPFIVLAVLLLGYSYVSYALSWAITALIVVLDLPVVSLP